MVLYTKFEAPCLDRQTGGKMKKRFSTGNDARVYVHRYTQVARGTSSIQLASCKRKLAWLFRKRPFKATYKKN